MTAAKGAGSAVIVGGGIGGLSAALALAKRGCRVTVIEQASTFGEIGAGIQIAPNGFHAMDYLGISERARARAVYIESLILMDGMSGEQIFHTPIDDAFRNYFGNPYAVIHRADLHGSLLEGCQASDLVTLINSEKIVSCENSANGAKVTTASGKTFEGDAVIGADGINSVIRKFIAKGDDPMRVSGHVAYRAVLPLEEMPEDLRWNAATLWGAPKCHLVHYPLQGWKTFNVVATFVTDLKDVGSNEPGKREEVLERFAHIVPRARKLLEIPKEWRRWVLGDRDPIPTWVDGRIALLGDAAHPTYQYFAQGACMAMEDAICLSSLFEKTGGDFDATFAAYQEKRIPRAYRVVLGAREMGRVFHAEGVERVVRNAWLKAKTPEDFRQSVKWLYAADASA